MSTRYPTRVPSELVSIAGPRAPLRPELPRVSARISPPSPNVLATQKRRAREVMANEVLKLEALEEERLKNLPGCENNFMCALAEFERINRPEQRYSPTVPSPEARRAADYLYEIEPTMPDYITKVKWRAGWNFGYSETLLKMVRALCSYCKDNYLSASDVQEFLETQYIARLKEFYLAEQYPFGNFEDLRARARRENPGVEIPEITVSDQEFQAGYKVLDMNEYNYAGKFFLQAFFGTSTRPAGTETIQFNFTKPLAKYPEGRLVIRQILAAFDKLYEVVKINKQRYTAIETEMETLQRDFPELQRETLAELRTRVGRARILEVGRRPPPKVTWSSRLLSLFR